MGDGWDYDVRNNPACTHYDGKGDCLLSDRVCPNWGRDLSCSSYEPKEEE